MNRVTSPELMVAVALAAASFTGACSAANGKTGDTGAVATPVTITSVEAIERPVARFIQATGTLVAEEQADVAAETSGRVVATPIERGTSTPEGAVLIRLSATETEAQVQEAEANAGQIEARLGLTAGAPFDVDAVPEVRNAKSASELAQSEFARIRSLLDQRVVSQSEFDQRRTQMEAARQQYDAARNGAAQQYQALQAARARVALAQKALADTVVRSPFDGLVAERLVSIGDYVTRGMKVAVVVRINPLRAQLTVPEQFISAVAVGQPIAFQVDAYPGRQFAARIRYVSPALQADRRALTVEAVLPNPRHELKPGLFATAQIQQPKPTPAILVPATAVRTSAGASRVYVINAERVEERVVTTGQSIESLIEISSGLQAGDRVAATNIAQLADGARVNPEE